ncbi:MAG TPA: LapA family protein [Gaiella sp.]|nr:LapA family protein [Gaiella sp.]
MSNAPVPPGDDRARTQSRGIPWKMVLWVAIALYALAFLLLNDHKQSIDFVLFTVNTRLPWLILLSMALGAALAVIGPRWWRSRRR